MPLRKTSPSGRSFMLPLLWAFALVAIYWLALNWQTLPSILISLKMSLHFH